MTPPNFTPKTLSERWDVSESTIRRKCRDGELPHFMIGSQIRIPLEVVMEIEQCKTQESSSTEKCGTTSIKMAAKQNVSHFAPRIVAKPIGVTRILSKPSR
ncbi:MAG: hypothetical protein DI551_08730 [Micavibrio aeruginosavorus]|uniref:Helix-turn-helix domain-containing protein n=1 Tax=Micavibrio aeruginosavorus TaxID=349221 RepID=A0A2W5MXE2_9BACT|nr:MAG: hypothetical protein DI551_08730 [Micavibrio aeruginosavorus]